MKHIQKDSQWVQEWVQELVLAVERRRTEGKHVGVSVSFVLF